MATRSVLLRYFGGISVRAPAVCHWRCACTLDGTAAVGLSAATAVETPFVLPTMPPKRSRQASAEEPRQATKKARKSELDVVPSEAAAMPLGGLHFATDNCANFVERTSLAKKVQNKQMGDKALQAVWRRAGFDDLIPDIGGVRGLAFPKQRGKPCDKIMPAAKLAGLQAYVRELDQAVIDQNAALLAAVAERLGDGPLQLESRHKVMDLGQGVQVHVAILDGRPHMVLALLLEACGVNAAWKSAQNYTEKSLIHYFVRIGVRIVGRTGPNLSDESPRGDLLDKYLREPVQDYERALAARSCGLVRGRSAWADAKPTYLIDFPLVVPALVVLKRPGCGQGELIRRFSASRPA